MPVQARRSVRARSVRALKRALTVGLLATVSALALTATAAAEGAFVIGDENAAVGSSVTFWGAQWWKLNSLSGGSAPASFKGFADNVEGISSCGETWTTRPGNSSKPPAAPLPEFIAVVVSSQITKSGPTISGDVQKVVLVQTNPGYEPNPGHAGTGTVVGVVCSPFENGGGGAS